MSSFILAIRKALPVLASRTTVRTIARVLIVMAVLAVLNLLVIQTDAAGSISVYFDRHPCGAVRWIYPGVVVAAVLAAALFSNWFFFEEKFQRLRTSATALLTATLLLIAIWIGDEMRFHPVPGVACTLGEYIVGRWLVHGLIYDRAGYRVMALSVVEFVFLFWVFLLVASPMMVIVD